MQGFRRATRPFSARQRHAPHEKRHPPASRTSASGHSLSLVSIPLGTMASQLTFRPTTGSPVALNANLLKAGDEFGTTTDLLALPRSAVCWPSSVHDTAHAQLLQPRAMIWRAERLSRVSRDGTVALGWSFFCAGAGPPFEPTPALAKNGYYIVPTWSNSGKAWTKSGATQT